MNRTIPDPRPTASSVGLVILDDPNGLAPRVADILRTAARRIGPFLSPWPFILVKTDAGMPDGAGRPGTTTTTIASGPFMRPMLRIMARVVDGPRLQRSDPATFLLRVARLVEGGDGAPTALDLRSIAVASALCDRDPAHAADLVVVHSATAFEPAFLYDEGFRGAGRMNSRILPVADHLTAMIDGLPRITRTTIVRDQKGIPTIGIAPFADKETGDISDADLELVGLSPHQFLESPAIHH